MFKRMKQLSDAMEATFFEEGTSVVKGHYFGGGSPAAPAPPAPPPVPPPSSQELELQQAQADLVRMQTDIIGKQQKSLELIEPNVQRLLGAEVAAKEFGLAQLQKAAEAPKTEQQILSEQVAQESLRQAQQALTKPDQPSAVLAQQEQDAFRSFKESVERTGGRVIGDSIDNAVVEGSSAGQRRLSLLKQRVGTQREIERNAIIGRATGTGFGGTQLGAGLTAQQLGLSQGLLQNPLQTSPQLGLVGLAGQGIQGAGVAQQGQQFTRRLQNQSNLAGFNAAFQASQQPDPFGQILGTALGVGLSSFSDRRLKRNIKKIGQFTKDISVYTWTYIWGEDSIGFIADEVKKVMPSAVTRHSSGFDMVNYKEVLNG